MGIEENIIPGKILCLNVCFPHETQFHDKYFVVVGLGYYLLLLKLNTSEQQSKIAKKFKERQFLMKKSVYPLLDHDRYLDCGTVWDTLITTEDIIKQLLERSTRIRGDIQDYHKNEIVNLTNISKSIEPRQKRIIRESFGMN